MSTHRRLLWVTDPTRGDAPLLGLARALLTLDGGLAPHLIVQYRDRSRLLLPDTARTLRALCRAARVPFLVNRELALAKQIDADGLHVPLDEWATEANRMPRTWLRSAPVHTLADARLAGDPGKGPARGPGFLTEVRKQTAESVRVFALGGVSAGNLDACVAAGADGVAILSALWSEAERSMLRTNPFVLAGNTDYTRRV
jgi:thiamine monophosphate synthase